MFFGIRRTAGRVFIGRMSMRMRRTGRLRSMPMDCDTCVLVLPCGRSAHTEAGWMAGAGRRVIAYISEMVEPELMYKLFDQVVGNLDDLVQCLC